MNQHVHLSKLLYRVPEAAEILGVGRTRIYEWLATGELASVKLNSSRLIPADALVEFAERLGCSPDTKPAS